MKRLGASGEPGKLPQCSEKNSDGVVIVDRRGNVQLANPAVGTLINSKVEERD